MLAAWELTRAVTASMVEESACAFFRTGRTLVSRNFAGHARAVRERNLAGTRHQSRIGEHKANGNAAPGVVL
jgi:hypothetical protein